MSVIARIGKKREARRAAKAALGEFARNYNRLELRDTLGRLASIGLGGFIPGSALIVLSRVYELDLLLTVGVGWFFTGVAACVFLGQTSSRKLDALSRKFYEAAGIDRNYGFNRSLAPGAKLGSFDHSFPDGRSGKVNVICDSEGTPMVFFAENQPSVILAAPQDAALMPSDSKKPLALTA